MKEHEKRKTNKKKSTTHSSNKLLCIRWQHSNCSLHFASRNLGVLSRFGCRSFSVLHLKTFFLVLSTFNLFFLLLLFQLVVAVSTFHWITCFSHYVNFFFSVDISSRWNASSGAATAATTAESLAFFFSLNCLNCCSKPIYFFLTSRYSLVMVFWNVKQNYQKVWNHSKRRVFAQFQMEKIKSFVRIGSVLFIQLCVCVFVFSFLSYFAIGNNLGQSLYVQLFISCWIFFIMLYHVVIL